MAAVVSGWRELPQAGDEVLQGTESEVKRAINNRIRKAQMEATLTDLEAINQSRREERERREIAERNENNSLDTAEDTLQINQEPTKKELRIVIKGDVSGSVEAVAGALQGIGNNLKFKVVIFLVHPTEQHFITMRIFHWWWWDSTIAENNVRYPLLHI